MDTAQSSYTEETLMSCGSSSTSCVNEVQYNMLCMWNKVLCMVSGHGVNQFTEV